MRGAPGIAPLHAMRAANGGGSIEGPGAVGTGEGIGRVSRAGAPSRALFRCFRALQSSRRLTTEAFPLLRVPPPRASGALPLRRVQQAEGPGPSHLRGHARARAAASGAGAARGELRRGARQGAGRGAAVAAVPGSPRPAIGPK